MANKEHVRRLKKGAHAWNGWRQKKAIRPRLAEAGLSGLNLRGANLQRADLAFADLSGADLRSANLSDAMLVGVDLRRSNLRRTKLAGANLLGADLSDSNLLYANLCEVELPSVRLRNANMRGADLDRTIIWDSDLSGANFTNARLFRAVFSNTDLSSVIGLETCDHHGPSIVDHETLRRSGSLPLSFLRGVGLPEALIEYLPSLLHQSIQHYSCFISYSTMDQDFGDRIHADLQNKGVRCWFAPHDMPIGGKILDEIDAAIRLRDKVLLILSEHSIKSDWVEDEVTKAFEEERKRGQIVLFPIRLDDTVMETDEAWAGKLRARHIGDFTRWKEHDAYSKSFERVLRDLTVKKPEPDS
jgi:uncharacterized protein YjbI with pentapeptide repeats